MGALEGISKSFLRQGQIGVGTGSTANNINQEDAAEATISALSVFHTIAEGLGKNLPGIGFGLGVAGLGKDIYNIRGQV